MAVQTVQNLPAQFVQDLGVDLAKQVTAQSGVPVISTGIAGISQQAGESADDFVLARTSDGWKDHLKEIKKGSGRSNTIKT